MTQGRLIYVMGPSGAGKDSLIEALRLRLGDIPLLVVRRYITRPPAIRGERHISVTPEHFERLADAGYFALHWTGHGFHYGIAAHTDRLLALGISLLANGSRSAFPAAVRRYPDLIPVMVTAPPHVLRDRLAKRGRESGEALEARLRRASLPVFRLPGTDWITIDNSGSIEVAASRLEHRIRNLLSCCGTI